MREIRKRSRLLAVLLVILLASSAPINVSAAAAKRKAKLMYKVDVRRNNCIQNFQIVDKNTIVLLQSLPNDENAYLVLCVKDKDGIYRETDAVTLGANVHHESVSLAGDYLWTCSTKNKEATITRYKFSIVEDSAKNKKIKLSKAIVLTNFTKATRNQEKLHKNCKDPSTCKVYRVNVATDYASNKIAFRIQMNGGHDVYYAIYNYKELNKLINDAVKKKKSTFDLSKNSNKKTHLTTIACSIRPNNYYQAFDIYSEKGKNYIYLSGGNSNQNGGVAQFTYKIDKNNTFQAIRDYDTKKYKMFSITHKATGEEVSKPEIEGIKVDKSGIYVNYLAWISRNSATKTNIASIYKMVK